MRVWVVENLPEDEPASREGVFNTPLRAWDALVAEVDRFVFPLDEFRVRLLSEDREVDKEKADVILRVDYQVGDAITLTGVYVEGTGNPAPTLAEWHDLQQVGSRLMRHAVEFAGFTRASEYHEAGFPAGVWRLRKP